MCMLGRIRSEVMQNNVRATACYTAAIYHAMLALFLLSAVAGMASGVAWLWLSWGGHPVIYFLAAVVLIGLIFSCGSAVSRTHALATDGWKAIQADTDDAARAQPAARSPATHLIDRG